MFSSSQSADGSMRPILPFLALMFCGVLCGAMIIPYMAYFLIEGLGRPPWTISAYTGVVICITIALNRRFARRIDAGGAGFPMIGIAAAGYLVGNVALVAAPGFWTAMTAGALGFGISASAMSTMFSLGTSLAARHGVSRARMNAFMRADASLAWMIGPAVSFLIADALGPVAVFRTGAVLALVWLALWWRILPRDIAAAPAPPRAEGQGGRDTGLWLAAAYIFCLSSAHSLTFSALPLFYVREAGLPGYAPGFAFTVKTFVEIIAIFSTPWLIARFGLRRSLAGTTALAVLAIVALSAVQSMPQMVGAAALEGLYYGLYASLGISFVQSFAEDRPAQATATYWNALMLSGLLAGPAVGMIAQAHDFRTVILVAAGVAALALGVLAAGARHARRAALRPA